LHVSYTPSATSLILESRRFTPTPLLVPTGSFARTNEEIIMEHADTLVEHTLVTERRAQGRRSQQRRQKHVPATEERRAGQERRQTGERRRQVDPTTCERDYTEEEIAFMRAMDQYKRDNRRPFPTWSEVLEVLYALGYRKVAEPTAMPGLPGESKKVPLKG
jgi:hypothetical protein